MASIRSLLLRGVRAMPNASVHYAWKIAKSLFHMDEHLRLGKNLPFIFDFPHFRKHLVHQHFLFCDLVHRTSRPFKYVPVKTV